MKACPRVVSVLVLTGLAAAASDVQTPSSKIHATVGHLFRDGDVPQRVWVLFADKGPIDAARALAELPRTYNRRAVERRRLRRTTAGLFDERDLPVHRPYVDAVTGTGATVRAASRWVNGVSALASPVQVESIAALPFVTKIQAVRRLTREVPPVESIDLDPPEGVAGGSFYGLAEEQLSQINLPALHQQGFTGAGVIIGVLDTGFATTHVAFNHPDKPLQVVAEWDFVNDDPETGPEPGDPISQHNHGTQVLGTMAAYEPGVLVGGAYDASYILTKPEDLTGEYLAEEDLFVAALEFIEANGGDIATSSLVFFDHYTQDQLDGLTSVMTNGFNTATSNGVHCFQAAGNEGHDLDPATSSLLPPADAFQVVTVGAVDVTGGSASFTSDGPTADGRVKPEILARGVDSATVTPNNDVGHAAVDGTSFATPTTAGAAACIVQAHPQWTVDQLRYALTRTADYYTANAAFDPLYIRGYGISDMAGAAAASPPHPADLDGDGEVGINDFLMLLGLWGPCPEPCPPHCTGDIDTDCTVGITDFLILLGNWG